MKATAKDLRFYSKELLDTANRGEDVVITYRGKPCAKLVSYVEENSGREELDLFGIWKDDPQSKDVDSYLRSMRKRRF